MMGGVSRKHLVDGRWVTVTEMAEALGVKRQAIYHQIYTRRCGLQAVVNMIRENQVLNGGASGARWMVDGKWTTIRQAAEKLGLTCCQVFSYMHRRKCTLQEAVDAYRDGRVRHGGKKPVQHRVGGRTMTTNEAAEKLGITDNAIRQHMHRTGDSLAKTVRYYEEKKIRDAEKRILRILREKT